MRFTENEVYHIYNRGNGKQPLFLSDAHYLLFLRKLHKEIAPYCNILCWCLMPNHFHLLIEATPASCEPVNTFGGKPMQRLAFRIGTLLSSYSQLLNKEDKASGSRFQPHTKAKPVTELMRELSFNGKRERYLTSLMHYIHQNPLRAGLVIGLEDWAYSSFRDFAGLRNGRLCRKDILFRLADYNEASFYEGSYAALR